MTIRMKKFFGNALLLAIAMLALFGLLSLMAWVDPWWSTGYNESSPLAQLGALLFWVLLGVAVSSLVLGIPESCFLPSVPAGFVMGGTAMVVVLFDSSIWLATGIACVVAIASICATLVLEMNRERLRPFLEESRPS